MKGYGLFHELTNNEDMPTFIDKVMGNNGALVSTTEKMRAGIPVGGMSPASDMGTGGAGYVFTRIKRLPTAKANRNAGLYFKKRLLRRQDAISYKSDYYGRVTDDFVSKNRGSTPKEWKGFSKISNYETIFKNSITLMDNIDTIVVRSNSERQKLLKVFAKHGIKELPDGRQIEALVVVQ